MDAVTAWLADAWARLQPGDPLTWDASLLVAAVAAVVCVLVPDVWRRAGIGVTVVHELGHAVVGMLAGRRFTGLMLRSDMSGHAVTYGPARGAGLVASTWAGYPAPALTGAAIAQLALHGWAPPILGVAIVLLLVGLVRSHSVFTVTVVAALTIATAVLWWFGTPPLLGAVVFGAGLFLVAGAWRHLASVLGRPTRQSDPAALARLTRVPSLAWSLTHAAALAGATWWLLAGLPVTF